MQDLIEIIFVSISTHINSPLYMDLDSSKFNKLRSPCNQTHQKSHLICYVSGGINDCAIIKAWTMHESLVSCNSNCPMWRMN